MFCFCFLAYGEEHINEFNIVLVNDSPLDDCPKLGDYEIIYNPIDLSTPLDKKLTDFYESDIKKTENLSGIALADWLETRYSESIKRP